MARVCWQDADVHAVARPALFVTSTRKNAYVQREQVHVSRSSWSTVKLHVILDVCLAQALAGAIMTTCVFAGELTHWLMCHR